MAFDMDSGALSSVAEQIHRGRMSEADKKLIVAFEMHATQNVEKSKAEGRPIFEDVPYIRIIVPGDRDSSIHRPVWDDPMHQMSDTARFPEQWKAFRENRKQAAEGTPLEQWPPLSRAQVLELKHFHVTTVEQLANLDDSVGRKFMGIQSLKQLAKDWLAKAKDGAVVTKLRSELQDRDERMDTLQRQLKEQGELIAKLQKKSDK